jgi:hypothetical protein
MEMHRPWQPQVKTPRGGTMIRRYFRLGLHFVQRMFAVNSNLGRASAGYDRANAVLITQTVQPERRSSRRRDGTCPWGIESRRNY